MVYCCKQKEQKFEPEFVLEKQMIKNMFLLKKYLLLKTSRFSDYENHQTICEKLLQIL